MLSASCSNTRYLNKGQSLLVANKVNLQGELNSTEKEDIRNSLNSPSVLLQTPNRKFLKMRVPLWLYNQKYKEKKSSWFWNWLLTEKNVEAPVIYDSLKTQRSAENMVNFLNNQGYFYASVQYTPRVKRRKTSITYNVNTGKSFIIDTIGYDIADTAIANIVGAGKAASLLKTGMPFKVETFSEEQDRITDLIRNAGYFRFGSDYVKFVVDTFNRDVFHNLLNPFENIEQVYKSASQERKPTLNVTVRIENPEDSTGNDAFRRFSINHIYIYPDYSFSGSPTDSTLQQINRRNLTFLYHKPIVRPRVLYRSVYFHHGELYSQDKYNYTVNKLNELGVWRFVTVDMDTVPGHPDLLDSRIFLIPGKKQEAGVELEATNSTDYIVGGALNLTYRNKNINRSANLLSASLKGGIELNSRQNRNLFIQAREFSGQANISFPRFITPWRIRDVGRFSNARTNLALGFNYLDRLRFFTLSSFSGSFGYDWDETAYKKWILKPFSFEYTRLFHVTDSFENQLNLNPFLRNSLQSTFIGGVGASFIFNTQDPLHPQRSFNYVRVNLDESGLLLKGIDATLKGISGNRTDFRKLTSVGISQYVKLDADYKHYFNRQHSSFVARIYGGIGIPYGGSDVMPYIKQFTAGGPNSMRAWRLRTLGPGSYLDPNLNNPNVFIDQTGELKLEGNLEYRFDIFKLFGGFMMLKGALFTDMGNIWNLNPNPYKPGAEIRLNRFYQDIAVGSGIGLRLDFSYAVIRLDFATPLKVPYEPRNYGWIVDQLAPFDKEWRKRNIIVNFAVGYPF
ncbi:BamA/TamA family outer membrane protein [Compostibacter hankyongensis]|uniref:BamA/TamA family outer membrane protein n=1 Tax=Compostibacter hankyongensis TaxID=1007089 RepID=A0ABP8FXE6_9BACT